MVSRASDTSQLPLGICQGWGFFSCHCIAGGACHPVSHHVFDPRDEQRPHSEVMLTRVLTDNRANGSCLNKLATSRYPLSVVVMEMAARETHGSLSGRQLVSQGLGSAGRRIGKRGHHRISRRAQSHHRFPGHQTSRTGQGTGVGRPNLPSRLLLRGRQPQGQAQLGREPVDEPSRITRGSGSPIRGYEQTKRDR